MGYATESHLVRSFVRALRASDAVFNVSACGKEFSNGVSSRPDIIAVCVSGEVIAVEAKLLRWRDAMQQAYRNTFFADRSYVLLPQPVAERALEYREDFSLRGVGICTLIDGTIQILALAPKLDPHNVFRRELAREHAFNGRLIRR